MSPPSRTPNDRCEARGALGSVDTTLETLAHPLRRDLIECCASANERLFDIHDVADDVVTARAAMGESIDTRDVLAQLHHQHLPFLADVGVIEFDPRGGQFRYERDERLERWLRRIRAGEPESPP